MKRSRPLEPAHFETSDRISGERLRYILETLSEGVWDWHIPSGSAVFSPAYSGMLGYEPAEFAKNYDEWRKLVHPEDVGRIDQAHADHIYGGKDFNVELRMRTKSGGWCWLLSRGVVVERNATGGAVRMVGTHQNIEARKQAEFHRARLEDEVRQAQKFESVGRLAGGIAHDFNNLLTVVNGNATLLLSEEGLSDDHADMLREIKQASDRAALLTRRLLAVGRKQVLRPKLVSVDETCRNLVPMLVRLLGEDVEITLSLDAGESSVFVDPSQLDQVLMNLAVNARDAMPTGGTFRIETKIISAGAPEAQSSPRARDWTLIAVTDSGVGIDSETQDRLFEPFFTTKERSKGSGLGLSVVHGIVTQSGGHIEVKSTPGSGSTFRVFLPRVQGRAPVATVGPESTAPAFGSETFLLVEDEPQVLAYVASAARSYGYRVLVAKDAEEARSIFSDEGATIDLLLTDVVLPKTSGRELAGTLSAINPRLKVLYMSGYPSDIIANHGVLEKEIALIEKPFSPQELAARVRELLGPGPPKCVLLLGLTDTTRGAVEEMLSRAGHKVLKANGAEGLHFQLDVILTELPVAEHEGVRTAEAIRRSHPDVPIIVLLESTEARFLAIQNTLGVAAVVAQPVSERFLIRTVCQALHGRTKTPS